MDIPIRNANRDDLTEIMKINHAVAYPEKKDGFLIQKRSIEEFQKLLKLSKYFLVAEAEGKIAGYLIALDETADYLENELFSFYAKNYEKFTFVDQIAILPECQGRGIGTKMYKKIRESESKRILIDIFLKPKNNQSIAFHEKLGFKFADEIINLKNGFESGVWELKSDY